MILELNDMNFDGLAIRSPIPVLVDFYSPSCIPCKKLEPMLIALAESARGRVRVCRLNVEAAPITARTYRVQGLPTLIVFRDGEAAMRMTGTRADEVALIVAEATRGRSAEAAYAQMDRMNGRQS